MRIEAKSSYLLNCLENVQRLLPKTSSVGVVTYIKVEVTKKEINFTAGDLNHFAQYTLKVDKNNVKVDQTGIYLFPRVITDLIKKLGAVVCIEIKELQANFTSNDPKINAKLSIPVLTADEYPELPEITDQASFSTKGKVLSEIISTTMYAAHNKEDSTGLDTVHFNIKESELILSATNRHRVARNKMKLDTKEELGNGVVISESFLQGLKKSLQNEEVFKVIFTSTYMIIESDKAKYFSALRQSKFPDLDGMLARITEPQITVKLNRQELLDSLDRVSLLKGANDSSYCQLTCNLSEPKSITVSSHLKEGLGTSQETIFIADTEGENYDFPLLLNVNYMIETLKAIPGREIEICVMAQMQPIIIYSAGTRDHLHALLPIRVENKSTDTKS